MSGRIEETNRLTALAVANDLEFSIRISANQKREVLEELKHRRPKWSKTVANVYVFATLLYLLLKAHTDQIDQVLVDVEYEGYEARIKEHILNLFRRQGIEVDPDLIDFHRVTKKSPSHKLAYAVYKGLREPDQVVTAEEVLAEF